MARRSTHDGVRVCLWSDGMLTWGHGEIIKHSPRPRTPEQSALALRAGWLVLGDVEVYDADELSALVEAARHVAARSGLPGDVRARVAAKSRPKMPGGWTVLSTDRNGKPTDRVWRFPRLSRWRDFAIFHRLGRYEVMVRHRGSAETYTPTGFAGMRLGDAFEAVRTIAVEAP